MKSKILLSAKRTLSKELKSIKTLSSTFDNNFYKAVQTINNTKGRIIVTGVGKSAHIGNKISEVENGYNDDGNNRHCSRGYRSGNDCILQEVFARACCQVAVPALFFPCLLAIMGRATNIGS